MDCRLNTSASVLLAVIVCFGGPTAAGTAGPSAVIPTAEVSNPRQPQVAVSEARAIHVVFGAGDAVFCASSTDGGHSYGEPVHVATVDRLALGKRRGPRIAAAAGVVVVTALGHQEGSVLAWRSTDGGQSWSAPAKVNDNSPGTANEGLHALAAAPSGDLYCVWLDHRVDQENQIFGAASTDGGKTWSENRLIYQSPSGSVCPCCHPAVTFDNEGRLYVMWRNSLAGFRDMYFAVSRDGGETFSRATKLGSGSWQLNACPMDGGCLAATKPGEVTTVWRRKRQVFQARPSQPGEQLLGGGEQPWVAGTPDGPWTVWLSQRGGALWLSSPKRTQQEKLSESANDPAIAASPSGKGPVVAVWKAGRGRDAAILSHVVGE